MLIPAFQFPKGKLASSAIFASLLSLLTTSLAQSKTKAPTPQSPVAYSYKDEALVIEKSQTTYRYEEDGTGEKVLYEKLRLQSEAGVRQFSVLSFPYASATETLQIAHLVAHHSDGTATETPSADAMAMPAPVTQEAPLYSDLKQMQIPLRGLRVGDVLECEVHIQRKNSEAPAQFWDSYGLQKILVTLSETVTLDLPVAKSVQVWSPDHKPSITEKDGRRIYSWSSVQLKPTSLQAKQEPFAPPVEIKPDLAWSTFRSWAEVGQWYRALSASRTVPTDALKAQADEVTRNAKSAREQVQALYSFVSSHIRYVGIDFGIGRFQPHMPSEVLINQYGDCKDKDTLLEALLHAKGFTTAPALIGVNLALAPDLPSPAFFNHVITTVSMPEGRIWLDSTPGIAPFQFLVSPIRDKQALIIPPSGDASLERTPAQPPFPFADTFEATATLNGAGDLNGKVKINYRSDSEIYLRAISQNLAPAQWDQGAQAISNSLGFSGTTSNSSFSRADDMSQPMQVSYDYARAPFGDWENLRIVALFPGRLGIPDPPEKQPESEIDLGALRTESAFSKIQLPANYTAELPDSIHAKTAFATCDVTYKLENGLFTAQRTLTVLQSRVPANAWEEYRKFTKTIFLGELQWVQLEAPGNSSKKITEATEPAVSNADASSLIRTVNQLERNNDLTGALAKLEEVKKLNPEQPFLWSNLGYVAMRQNRIDEAKDDFRHELARHPNESFVVDLFAGMLITHQDTDEALTVLSKYFDSDATDQQADLMLAGLQARTSVPAAIATLRRASEAAPDKPYLQTAMADYMVRNHQESDAAAVIRALLAKGTDDANLLNSAAYVLAQSKSDLPLAEGNPENPSRFLLARQRGKKSVAAYEKMRWIPSSTSAAACFSPTTAARRCAISSCRCERFSAQ